jgi:hypothetical protein
LDEPQEVVEYWAKVTVARMFVNMASGQRGLVLFPLIANSRHRNLCVLHCASIQESDVSHGSGLSLGVHLHTVPAIEDDRGVIRMTDAPSGIDASIPPHDLPTTLPLSGIQAIVGILADPAGIPVVDIDRLAASSIAELHVVGLAAATAAQRLIAKDQFIVHLDAADGDEEPFPLAVKRLVVSLESLAGTNLLEIQSDLDTGRLEGLLGGLDTAHATSLLGDSRHEPMALIVTAKEFAFGLWTALHQQKEMAVIGLDIHHGHFGGLAGSVEGNVEILTLVVGADIETRDAQTLTKSVVPTGAGLTDLDPGPHLMEPPFQNLYVHVTSLGDSI